MASSGNFCTLNPATQPNSGTFSESNLLFTHTAGAWRTTAGTMCMTTGKWYWEAYQYEDLVGNGFPCGIYDMDSGLFVKQMAGDYPGQSSSSQGANYSCYTNSGSYAQKRYNGTTLSMTIDDGDSGDVWQCAFDADAGKIWFGKNNTWDNNANPALGSNESYASISSSKWAPITCSYNDSNSENYPQNFGQDDTFAGRITAQGNTDDNGHGVFKYAPPTGFLALCSANLPISDDIDPAQTDNDFPSKQFNAVAYTGNGSTQSISVGFKPDLVWYKRRDTTNPGIIMDSTRGTSSALEPSNNNAADTNFTQGVTSFDTNGFSLGSQVQGNGSGGNLIAWCWRAGGGTTSSNTQGDVTSTVQANQAAGFSIVTFTGTLGESASTASVGHGLTAIPDFIISKSYDTGSKDWTVLHSGLTSRNYKLTLNADYAEEDRSSAGDMSSLFTTTTYGTNATTGLNQSGRNYIAYVWHNVEGMQKFGKFTGNGNTDGPFVYTGFRPRMIFLRRTTSGYFNVIDSARDTYNPVNKYLSWNVGDAEGSGANVDFLSNGFKLRTTSSGFNQSGTTFVYGAWGDVPFKYNNTF